MSLYNGQVIDIHTHIFNAHCLPVAGALHSKGVPVLLANVLKPMINSLTGKLDEYKDGGEEGFYKLIVDIEESGREDLKLLTGALLQVSSAIIEKNIQKSGSSRLFIQSHNGRVSVEQALQEYPLFIILLNIEAFASVNSDSFPEKQPECFYIDSDAGKDEISRTIQHYIQYRFEYPLTILLASVSDIVTDGVHTGVNTLRFMMMMMLSTETIARKLFSTYQKNNHGLKAVQLMMDMEKAYDEEPQILFKDQLHLFADTMNIINSGDKRLFGFVAFDPRRDNSTVMVKMGIRLGNLGIKLYPPLGYMPINNSNTKLDKRLIELYDYCIEPGNDIPIIVHSTAFGFQVKEGSGFLSNPAFWQNVLEMNNHKYKSLRLCYGHAGGMGKINNGKVTVPGWGVPDKEWYGEGDMNFARTVVKHCRQYLNVYCDLSYFDEIMRINPDTSGMLSYFRHHFIREMKSDNGGAYRFSDKVMYGSDWHMPEMIPRLNKYFDFFRELFNDAELISYRENFFFRNALKFLKQDR